MRSLAIDMASPHRTAMEERNLRDVWEDQLRREMANNGFIDAEFEFESDSLWEEDTFVEDGGTPRNSQTLYT